MLVIFTYFEICVPQGQGTIAVSGFELARHNFSAIVVIGTDCTGNCKSNYHTIMTTTTPIFWGGTNVIFKGNTNQLQ